MTQENRNKDEKKTARTPDKMMMRETGADQEIGRKSCIHTKDMRQSVRHDKRIRQESHGLSLPAGRT